MEAKFYQYFLDRFLEGGVVPGMRAMQNTSAVNQHPPVDEPQLN
jgi:hypothetical protein